MDVKIVTHFPKTLWDCSHSLVAGDSADGVVTLKVCSCALSKME